jgi:hypothetical protein
MITRARVTARTMIHPRVTARTMITARVTARTMITVSAKGTCRARGRSR